MSTGGRDLAAPVFQGAAEGARPIDAELVADRLWQLGASGIEERPDGTLRAGFGGAAEAAAAATALGGIIVEVDDEPAWEAWRQGLGATRTGRLVVRPPWIAPAQLAPDELDVVIDPRRCFGDGAHATTRLCLLELSRRVRPGGQVLDVGCGTGVLAIAAALLGAESVEAIDCDQAAVALTTDNARRNGVDHRVRASGEPLHRVGPADLVVANILAPTLVELAPALVASVAPGGVLVIAGVVEGRTEHVLAALHPLREITSSGMGAWRRVTLGTVG